MRTFACSQYPLNPDESSCCICSVEPAEPQLKHSSGYFRLNSDEESFELHSKILYSFYHFNLDELRNAILISNLSFFDNKLVVGWDIN